MSDGKFQLIGREPLAGLVARLAAGDSSAMVSLIDMTRPFLMRIAKKLLSSREDAEEVVSDVYLYIWRNAHSYSCDRGPVLAWIAVICRCRGIDRIRKEKTRIKCMPEAEVTCFSEDSLAEPRHMNLRHPYGGSPLQSALKQLSPIQRQLLELAFVEDLTHLAIAAKTGLALGTIKSHIRRALRRLQAALMPDHQCADLIRNLNMIGGAQYPREDHGFAGPTLSDCLRQAV